MISAPSTPQQSVSGKALMVDIKLGQQAGTPAKFLFGKRDDTSFGFILKTFFLGPLMRNEAKRQMLTILSRPVFKDSPEVKKLTSHIRNLKWGTGVDAGMVSTVIAKTILHGRRDPSGKTAFQWTPFIDRSIQDEMVDAYLDNPVNLKSEILECFKNRSDVLPGLNKLIFCAIHADHEVRMTDLKQMEKLMDKIEDQKRSSAMKLSFELDRKIREVFQHVVKRFDEAPDEDPVRKVQAEN